MAPTDALALKGRGFSRAEGRTLNLGSRALARELNGLQYFPYGHSTAIKAITRRKKRGGKKARESEEAEDALVPSGFPCQSYAFDSLQIVLDRDLFPSF